MTDYKNETLEAQQLIVPVRGFYDEAINMISQFPDTFHYFKAACDDHLEPIKPGLLTQIHTILPLVRDSDGKLQGYDLGLRGVVSREYIHLYNSWLESGQKNTDKLKVFLQQKMLVSLHMIKGASKYSSQFNFNQKKSALEIWFDDFEMRWNAHLQIAIDKYKERYYLAIESLRNDSRTDEDAVTMVKHGLHHEIWGYTYPETSNTKIPAMEAIYGSIHVYDD